MLLVALAIAGQTACDSNKSTTDTHTADHTAQTTDAGHTDQHDEHADMGHTQAGAGEEVTTFENASPEAQQEIRILLTNYLQLKDALVASNAEQAKAAAQEIQKVADKGAAAGLSGDQQTYYTAQVASIKEDAEHIQGTNEVSHMRDYFTTLSKSTYRLVKAFDANENPVYYQHCPMAMDNTGAYWLSSNEEVRNPYFGDAMLKCGSVVETVN